MALNSLEKEWAGFAEMVFRGTTPSAAQLQEMRKAFFAGAWVVVNAMQEIGEPHVSEEQGEAYFHDRIAECQAFKRQMMREYAEGN